MQLLDRAEDLARGTDAARLAGRQPFANGRHLWALHVSSACRARMRSVLRDPGFRPWVARRLNRGLGSLSQRKRIGLMTYRWNFVAGAVVLSLDTSGGTLTTSSHPFQ